MKLILNTLILGAALACFATTGFAQEPAKAKPAAKATAKAKAKPKAKAKAKPESAASANDDKDVDVAKAIAVEMQCAHGDKVTLYQNAEDEKHVGMRWNKRLVRLDQVSTTTGAKRYESSKHGLVWIGIPAKGMLLDSKKGQQLANECRTKEQVAAQSQPQEPAQPQIFQEAQK